MKKILIALLIGFLILPSALADITLVDPYAQAAPENALAEALAARLEKALGCAVSVRHEADEAQAVNAFLALPDADSALLLCSQEAMILGLQGYTDEDLRTAVHPVGCVAASGSRVYAAPGAVELAPDTTQDALIAYTDENAYQLCIARLVDASHTDFLTMQATEEMYVDQSLYMTFEEAVQAAKDGAPDLIAFSNAMTPDAAAAYTPLYDAGLPGVWQGLFVKSEGAEQLAQQVAEALPAIYQEEAWQALLSQGGYDAEAPVERAAFEETVSDLFRAYVQYLTNEGLFFYDQ